ncbi:CBS domain-containing protein [Alteromonas sediminis]|uniref:CBS domain-containing protein n=1 Tax=Alteromonas sediminis TaxID=2259342 RepID=A0A3N5YMI7_9ALTE|nr:CBS domain-containing protein [Alteromonas sediminis]RPJ66621.1 CBS domain-containing protein [Alteromonas sediminis]
MKELKLNQIGDIRAFVTPSEFSELTLKSSALLFFTDFSKVRPLIIESGVSALETIHLMKKAHVKLKLVVDENEQLVGIVSADDLIERKFVQKLGDGTKRHELSISDFMTPREKLTVLEFSDVEKANIGAVIGTLRNSGKQHCLVIDSDKKVIRGLFSVSDISRKLKVDIDILDQPSFAKLANSLE